MTEATLDRLWSVHEIQQLAFRYAWAFDIRDKELFLSLWAEPDESDGVSTYPQIDLRSIRRDLDLFFDRGPSVMFVGNHLIEFEDERNAHGVVYAWPQVREDDGFIDQQVVYRDRYVLRGERWKFLHRRHLLRYGIGRERDPFDQAAAEWPERQVGRGVGPEELAPEQADWFAPRRRP